MDKRKRILRNVFLLAALLCVATAAFSYADEAADEERIRTNYARISAGYTFRSYSGEDIAFPAQEYVEDLNRDAVVRNEEAMDYSRDFLDKDGKEKNAKRALRVSEGDSVTFAFNVPSDAVFQLGLEAHAAGDVAAVRLALAVDGACPFYEARDLALSLTGSGWETVLPTDAAGRLG